MGYRCIRGDGARPCVSVIAFDNKTGNPLEKPIKKYKSVKSGDVVQWVDFCSRKHFEPTDEETIRQDAQDLNDMKRELTDLGSKLPDDATFAECADSLSKLKAKAIKSYISSKKRRLFLPSDKNEIVEPTNAELKAECKEKGIKFLPTDNKAKLKERLAGTDKDE